MHCWLKSFFNLLSTSSFPLLIGNFMCLYCFCWNIWSVFCPHFITVQRLCGHSCSFGVSLTWPWTENLLPAYRFNSRANQYSSVSKNVANTDFYFRSQKALAVIWNSECFKFFTNKNKNCILHPLKGALNQDLPFKILLFVSVGNNFLLNALPGGSTS